MNIVVKKNNVFYLNNPGLAYSEGHTSYLGVATHYFNRYEIYNYYLPKPVITTISKIDHYFELLKKYTSDIPDKFKRIINSRCDWLDTAVSILKRVEYVFSAKIPLVVPHRHGGAPWCVFGKAENTPNQSPIVFSTLPDVLNYYTKQYNMAPCPPIVSINLFHKCGDGVKSLNDLSICLNPNKKITTAVMFLADILYNTSPEKSLFFDVFTNDLRKGAKEVDKLPWMKARHHAFAKTIEELNRHPKPLFSSTTHYYAIKIKELTGRGVFSKGSKTTTFDQINKPAINNENNREDNEYEIYA
jgi:hypothetical protein